MQRDEIIISYRETEIHRVTYQIGRRTKGFFYLVDRPSMTSRVFDSLSEELRRLFNSFVPEDHMIPLF